MAFPDAIRCGQHEATCTYGPALPLTQMRCRKCGISINTYEDGGISSDRRSKHEDTCRGSDVANRTCLGCGKIYSGDRAHHSRAIHEADCRRRKFENALKEWFFVTKQGEPPSAPTPEPQQSLWICKCWYVVSSRSCRDLKNQHFKTCRGSYEANVRCKKCGHSFETVEQRSSHEPTCAGPPAAKKQRTSQGSLEYFKLRAKLITDSYNSQQQNADKPSDGFEVEPETTAAKRRRTIAVPGRG